MIREDLIGAVVCIGNFDGVHIAHRQIIKTTVDEARLLGVKSCLVKFSPHPDQFFAREHTYIYNDGYNDKIIKSLGIDEIITFQFDQALADLSPEGFLDKINFSFFPKKIVTGYNFRFGKKRAGDVNFIARYCQAKGSTFQLVDQMSMDNLQISSTNIRHFIKNGRFMIANAMLCDKFTITGNVICGSDRGGKELGFPTANMLYENGGVQMPYGVYLVRSNIDDVDYFGLANFGTRPTFEDTEHPVFETHFLGLERNIYGKELAVQVLLFMRPERKFPTISSLKYQIKMDLRAADYVIRNLNNQYRKIA